MYPWYGFSLDIFLTHLLTWKRFEQNEFINFNEFYIVHFAKPVLLIVCLNQYTVIT